MSWFHPVSLAPTMPTVFPLFLPSSSLPKICDPCLQEPDSCPPLGLCTHHVPVPGWRFTIPSQAPSQCQVRTSRFIKKDVSHLASSFSTYPRPVLPSKVSSHCSWPCFSCLSWSRESSGLLRPLDISPAPLPP